ncbi:VOC family protein [Phenylobacterium sp.]|uniref:VOC family protein n=1 Tax=Phenylobacterium sp. TaxID=1871053 RepID=UPI0039C9C0EB
MLLSHLVLRAREPKRLAAFYSALGLEFRDEQHGRGPKHVSAEVGAGVLEIYPLNEGQEPTTGVRLGFSVEDLETACRSAERSFGQLVTAPRRSDWGYRATVRDPAGHLVDLVQA